ncbi:MAG TPA: gliding motility-associated C-terminal domain-containing protein [Crocinitomicaceae bacterium]|nr:gliding motility-associated C-terminal domain-containing protein [Crocinitomicaceae bacterium]
MNLKKQILTLLVVSLLGFSVNAQNSSNTINLNIRGYFVEKALEEGKKIIDKHSFQHYLSNNYEKYKTILTASIEKKYDKNSIKNIDVYTMLCQELDVVAKQAVLDFEKNPNSQSNNTKGSSNDDFAPKGPNEPCTNSNFETGNFTGWDLEKGTVTNQPFGVQNMSTTTAGAQHTIVTGGFDPNVPNNALPQLYPGGGTSSVLLGDLKEGYDAASLKHTFKVDANSTSFMYHYAIIMEDAGHTPGEQPFFKVNMYNESGQSLTCGEYSVIAGPSGDPGFVSFQMTIPPILPFLPSTQSQAYYLPWRTTFIPLENYIGQNITLEFIVGDCSQGGHRGYAYIDADCSALTLTKSADASCDGAPIVMNAPAGAASYTWTVPTGATNPGNVASFSTAVTGPYSVTVTPVSGSGCSIVLHDTINGSSDHPVADFTVQPTNICVGGSVTVQDLSHVVGTSSITSWAWDFNGDGTTDNTTQTPPPYVFNSAGTYNIKLTVGNNGCTDTKTIPVIVSAGVTATWTPPNPLCANAGVINLNDLITGTPGGTWSGTGVSGNTYNPAAGTSDITYSVSSAVCDANETHTITVSPLPVIDFSIQPDVCAMAQPVPLNATPAGGTFTVNGQQITEFDPTSYTLGQYNVTYTVADPTNPQCIATASSPINVVDGLPITSNIPNYFCFGASDFTVTMNPAGGILTADSTWIVSGDELLIYNAPTGDYTVFYEYTSPEGCKSSYQKTFTVGKELKVSYEFAQDCYQNVTLTANPIVGNFVQYTWIIDNTTQIGTGNPFTGYVEQFGEHEFTVEAIDNYGCMATYSHKDSVAEGVKAGMFQIPNVITANGDGINDVIFMPMMDNDCINYEVLILNRWGNLVYKADKSNPTFGGKDLNGKALTDGVYFYKVVSDSFDCESDEYKPICYGFITIVTKK